MTVTDKHLNECEVCGKWFSTRRRDARICSAKCRMKAHRRGALLVENWPGTFCSNNKWRGVSGRSRNVLAVHLLGNGVPRALGEYVARHVARVTLGMAQAVKR